VNLRSNPVVVVQVKAKFSMRTIKALVFSLPSLALLGGQVAIGLTASSVFSAPVYAADKQVSAKVGKPLKSPGAG
jgi:hypothetical protein